MTTFFVRRRRRRLRHRREVEHARGMHSRDRQKQTEEQSRASRGSYEDIGTVIDPNTTRVSKL